MSERALFKPVRVTLGLSGITAMNTAMANVLLAAMVFKAGGNPSSPTDVFKNISARIIEIVLERAKDNKLTRQEMSELTEIATAYMEVLKAIK